MTNRQKLMKVWPVCALYILTMAPHIWCMCSLHSGLFNDPTPTWIVKMGIKFALYAMLAPSIFLLITVWLSRRWTLILSYLIWPFLFLNVLAISMYWRYFGDIPHIRQLPKLRNLDEIGGHVVHQVLGISDIFTICCLVALLAILTRKHVAKVLSKRAAIILAGSACCASLLFSATQYWRRDLAGETRYGYAKTVRTFGMLDTYAYMIATELFPRKRVPVPFPNKINPPKSTTPKLGQANIIMIQVESLDWHAMGLDVDNKPIMPFLRRFRKRCVYFPNFVAHHSGGGSSDAELSSFLSLLPLSSHSGLMTADYDKLSPLPRVLHSAGYQAIAFHANTGAFLSRNAVYPRLGFGQFRDARSYTGQAKGWDSKDNAFFEQTLPMIESLKQPFFAFLITMQSHGPFRNHGGEASWPEYSRNQTDFLLSMREVDRALEQFIDHLQGTAFWKNTIVVIYGDHSSGVFPVKIENVPLLIHHPDLTPATIDTVVSHVDIAPTVCALTGISEGQGWLGTSVFEMNGGRVILNDLSTVQAKYGKLIRSAPDLDNEIYRKFSESVLK